MTSVRISYAQNREDLVLAGYLKDVDIGFYVDVGANHPSHDSVTRRFYERGWRGINIEPNPRLHALLCEDRPRDVNLCIGVSSAAGTMRLRAYDQIDGLSSFSRDAHEQVAHAHPAARHRDLECSVATLAEILAEHRGDGAVHFAKIDVEGLELEVLLGNDWQRFRPWVACIERNLAHARQAAIDALLEAHSYRRAFYDGVNDFWLADEHAALQRRFSYAGDVVMVAPLPPPRVLPLEQLLALEGGAFVDAAYASILHRHADPAGRAHYASALSDGSSSKPAVLRALAASEEAQTRGLGAPWLAQLAGHAQQAESLPRPWLQRLRGR